jgi:5-methylcytosine-specific restriction endonuclease McrA
LVVSGCFFSFCRGGFGVHPDSHLETDKRARDVRDPVVSELAKRRAHGICQLCDRDAPFLDGDNEPYLEVHHVQWLSRGGRDSLDNAVALCPNCHRKMHVLDQRKDREFLKGKAQLPFE